ncbi:MAG TPA: DUF2884 family protein [Rudaea sp.]|nr:DUF2884 family protein [Rudaea sp.]
MKAMRNLFAALTLTLLVAACGDNDSSVFRHISVLDHSRIAVHAHNAADAIVTANGDLSIAGNNVVLTAEQRGLLQHYFAAVIALQADAIATGKAGAQTATTALGSVVSGLANGDPDKIGDDIEKQADEVDVAATKVCADLSAIQTNQDAIAAQLPAFKPYASIEAKQALECNRHEVRIR